MTAAVGADRIHVTMSVVSWQADSPGQSPRMLRRVTVAAAVISTCALPVVMSVRPLSSYDLGYHLAYGEEFLDTGRPVSTNAFIYTLGQNRPPSSGPPPPPGPGCWYDDDGRYHFANANWGSQVIMSAVGRLGAEGGLCTLQSLLVAGTFALILLTMRRVGVPWLWSAGGVVMVTLVAQGRFNLRPEVFGYLIVAWQLYILAPRAMRQEGAITPKTVVALCLMQVVLVNLHSYFMLGLALTVISIGDRLVRLALGPLRDRRVDTPGLWRDAKLLSVALGIQLIACFVNPWTWRGAVLPVQTLAFMKAHGIAGSDPLTSGHPWSHIGELYRPFATGAFVGTWATYAYCVLLAVSCVGVVGALVRRRWGWGVLIAVMAVMSLSMRRNIALAAVLITPVALAAMWELIHPAVRRVGNGVRAAVTYCSAVAIAAGATILCTSVVTQHFYFSERSAWRFGTGVSRLVVPLDAAGWLERHRPEGRVWCDYDISSNLYYFTDPHPDVPILTNTWAYPPSVMAEVLDYGAGRKDFSGAVADYSVETVVLQAGRGTIPLVRKLSGDERWAVVFAGGMHVIFVRRDGANAALADRAAITPQSLDIDRHAASLEALDPVKAHSLYVGGMTLYRLGWSGRAMEIFRRVLRRDESYHQAWNMLGVCIAERGNSRLGQEDLAARDDFIEARKCFLRAHQLQPNYAEANENLLRVDKQLGALESAPAAAP